MTTIRYPAQPARRGGAGRARTWWGKSWIRAVEEASFGEAELRQARTLARSGRVGAITITERGFVAAIEDSDGMWAASGETARLGEAEIVAFCEAVEAGAGRVGALLAGDLPYDLVEHAEEAGVELLPYGSELVTSCSCDAWLDPCAHALAVLYQLAWLMDDDPFVLLHLAGLSRVTLLARLDERAASGQGSDGSPDADLDTAADAVLRAARMVELIDSGDPVDHLV